MRRYQPDLDRQNLMAYVRDNLQSCWDMDASAILHAAAIMEVYRCPLSHADASLHDRISALAEDYCEDSGIDAETLWEEIDAEEIFLYL